VRGYTLRQARAFMAAIDRREADRARAEMAGQAIAIVTALSGGDALKKLIGA
jgi:hypothetical protein